MDYLLNDEVENPMNDLKKSNFRVTYHLLDGKQIESYYTDRTYSQVKRNINNNLERFNFPLEHNPTTHVTTKHITSIEIVAIDASLSIMQKGIPRVVFDSGLIIENPDYRGSQLIYEDEYPE